MNAFSLALDLQRVGVTDDIAVFETNDPVGVLLSQLRIVGDHDDEAVCRNFL